MSSFSNVVCLFIFWMFEFEFSRLKIVVTARGCKRHLLDLLAPNLINNYNWIKSFKTEKKQAERKKQLKVLIYYICFNFHGHSSSCGFDLSDCWLYSWPHRIVNSTYLCDGPEQLTSTFRDSSRCWLCWLNRIRKHQTKDICFYRVDVRCIVSVSFHGSVSKKFDIWKN